MSASLLAASIERSTAAALLVMPSTRPASRKRRSARGSGLGLALVQQRLQVAPLCARQLDDAHRPAGEARPP
jgi:hypothetical protein